jgi:uncharacterized integral membrane protein (TIGR00697 family)
MSRFRKLVGLYWEQVLTSLYIVLMVVSPIMSMKVLNVGPLTFAGGVFSAMLAYALIDVVNELRGKDKARQTVWSGLWCKMFVFLAVIPLTVALPALIPTKGAVFNQMFTLGIRLFVATEVINLLMNLIVDIPFFVWLKQFKFNWFIRANLTNILSWTIAAILFVLLGYYGTPQFTSKLLIGQILVRYPLTFIYTAVLSLVVRYIKTIEK